MNVLIDAAAMAGEADPDGWVERSVWDWQGVPGVTVGSNPGSSLVTLEQEEPEFGFGGYRVVVTRQQAQALAVALHAAVGRPLLLPPLTAVQRAWVVAMAKAVVETDRSPQFGREERLAWSMHRWGFWTARRLDALVQAVAVWRVEQEVARDA